MSTDWRSLDVGGHTVRLPTAEIRRFSHSVPGGGTTCARQIYH